jgi:hypothetical protein
MLGFELTAEDVLVGPGGARASKLSLKATACALLGVAVILVAVALVVVAWQLG